MVPSLMAQPSVPTSTLVSTERAEGKKWAVCNVQAERLDPHPGEAGTSGNSGGGVGMELIKGEGGHSSRVHQREQKQRRAGNCQSLVLGRRERRPWR